MTIPPNGKNHQPIKADGSNGIRLYLNKTVKMKKKRVTYGVYGMMEYQAIIKIGRATLKVLFTDGSMTAIGQNPAKYTTSDFLVQHAIENSRDFKRGRITVLNTIELDEELKIERNAAKGSVLSAQAPAAADAIPKLEDTPKAADAGVGKAEETGGAEETVSDNDAQEPSDETEKGKVELEFTDNQEAKDYLARNFGVKPGSMRSREDIKATGSIYGVDIMFSNEK